MTTVLHVDDDADLLEIASFYMKAQFPELEVVTALTARQALQILRTYSIDVIVSDYQMDTIDGLEFLKMVRAEDEVTPFIMLTGKGREEVAIKALNLGASYYLKKEGSPKVLYAELVHLIRNSLRHCRAEKELRESLQALQHSEVRYRTLFESAPVAIILVDADGNIIEANEQFCELFGYSLSELMDINSEKLYADPNLRKSLLEELRKDGHITDYDVFCRKKEGSIFSAILNGSVVEYPGQQVFFGMIRDITDQLQMEQTLRLTQFSLENSPVPVYWIRADASIAYANKEACEQLGYSREELVGMYISDIDTNYSLETYRERFPNLVKQRSMRFESEHLTKDGLTFPVEVMAHIISIGGIYYNCAMALDISKHHELEVTQKHYSHLLSTVSEAILSIDDEDRVVTWNKAAEKIYGWTKEEAIGEDLQAMLQTEFVGTSEEDVLKTLDAVGHWSGTARQQCKDGSTVETLTSITVMKKSDGTSMGMVGVNYELTPLIETRRLLEQSREKYQSVVLSSPYGIFIHRDKKLLYANPAASRILGEENHESLYGSDIMDFVPPDRRESVEERVASVYQGEADSMNLEAQWLQVDGTSIDVEIYVTRIMYEGSPATLTMFSDISERKKIERELQESEQRIATILSSLQDMIFIQDENDRYKEFYGSEDSPLYVPPEHFLGKHVSDVLPSRIVKEYTKKSARVRETGLRELLEYSLEIDGEEHWFSAAVDIHEDNKSVIVTVRDITELRETKTALSESRLRLRSLYEYVPYPIVLAELESQMIIGFNEAAANFYGYSQSELTDLMLSDIDVIEDEEDVHEHIKLLIRDGVHTFQTKHLRKDGLIRDVFVSIRIIKIEGTDYVQAVVVDNTEQKAIEQSLKRKNIELSEFVHAMAHDIRGSLHNIQGYVHLLQDDYDEETASRIIETSKRLGSLLERSVILADAGIVADTNQEVDLTSLVESVSASELPASVYVEIGDLPTVMGDYHKIGQVFSNLVSNAIEHGEAKTIKIESRDLPTGIEILISNDGMAIPEDLREKIFERGFTTKPSGTGLGMSIVKRIVEAHGWRIRLLSTEQTTFSILIPN